MNRLIIYFFIPAITLYHVPSMEFAPDLMWLTITPFIVYLVAILYIRSLRKIYALDRPTEGALIMTSGISSISFVGFPIFEILYGEEGLALGIVLSLAGTILVFNTIGIATGLRYASHSDSGRKNLGRQLLTFPPFIAFLLALCLNYFELSFTGAFHQLLQRLSGSFAVIALLAIGMQIDLRLDRQILNHIALGQFYKLILAPALIYVFLWHLVGVQNTVAKVCVLGSGIGSMNAISIVAAELGLNPRLAMAMPAISIPLSIPLLFLIDFLIG